MAKVEYWSVDKARRKYTTYCEQKRNEREEGLICRKYRHGDQWTAEELARLKARNQPAITYNRVDRKINGVVGLAERLRQDPKAYPRMPNNPQLAQLQAQGLLPVGTAPDQEKGAELATIVINQVLDQNRWQDLLPKIANDGAVEPLAGVEYELVKDKRYGDYNLVIRRVRSWHVFYDPKSSEEDFSDSRYLGVSKMIDLDTAIEMFPDKEAELENIRAAGGTAEADNEYDPAQVAWTMDAGNKIRLTDIWYKQRGRWYFKIFAANVTLMDGVSPFEDDQGNSFPKYRLWSNAVDHDNDRYGLVRNMKGPQDEINHRRSKGLHALNTTRVYLTEGSVTDPEKIREEIHRNDGVIITPPGVEVTEKSNAEQVSGNLELLQEAKNEIENFGPNPALIGNGMNNRSGRAIQLMQQSGVAELGPYLLNFRAWKMQVYRDVWSITKKYWTAHRWLRVTDDENMLQFYQINAQQYDPATQQMQLVNALGELDVDIIIDEGPDVVNLMQDVLETLGQLGQGVVPPQVIIELANLPPKVKKTIMSFFEQAQTPSPEQQMAAKLELAGKQAAVEKTQSDVLLNRAKAMQAGASAGKAQADTAKTEAEAAGLTLNNAAMAAAPFNFAPMGPMEATMAPATGGSGEAFGV